MRFKKTIKKKKMIYVHAYGRTHTQTHTHTHTHTHHTMEYYSALKEKKILLFVTKCMGLENITLNEISQAEINKCYIFSLT
jgi:hypothetical protein